MTQHMTQLKDPIADEASKAAIREAMADLVQHREWNAAAEEQYRAATALEREANDLWQRTMRAVRLKREALTKLTQKRHIDLFNEAMESE